MEENNPASPTQPRAEQARRKKRKLIITSALIAVIIILIIIMQPPAGVYIEAYGVIKLDNQTHLLESKYIDCEIDRQVFKLINNTPLGGVIGNESLVTGYLLNDTIKVISINLNYDLAAACAIFHEEDIELELPSAMTYEVTPDEKTDITYNISNNQDQRLEYDSVITVDCAVEREYVTGYLNPYETVLVIFEVTCSEGEHNANIHTIFRDEVGSVHTQDDLIIITSSR